MANWNKIEKLTRRNKRNVLFPKLEMVSTIAIICNKQHEPSNIMANFPSAKTIDVYHFHDEKRNEQASEYDFFKSDITIFGNPSKKIISSFCEVPYDLLINFCDRTGFFTEYIAAMSKAKFKIAISGKQNHGFDLFIKMEGNSAERFVEEIVKTLKSLKN